MFFNNFSRKSENNKLYFEALAELENGYAYGASVAFNGLFHINMKNGESEFISFFPKENLNKERLFYSACFINNKVYFAPNAANYIHIFHIDTNEIKIIEIKSDIYKPSNKSMKFADAFIYDDSVYMIGASYPAVLKINPLSDEIEYYPFGIEDKFFFRRGIIKDGKYYVASVVSNDFIEIDLTNLEIHKYTLPDTHGSSWNICDDGENIWFPPRCSGDNFIRWNPKTGEFIQISDFCGNITTEQTPLFLYSYYNNGFIYLIPHRCNLFLRINVNTLKIEEDTSFIHNKENEKIDYCCRYGENIYISKSPMDKLFYGLKNIESFSLNTTSQEMKFFEFSFKYGKNRFLECFMKYFNRDKYDIEDKPVELCGEKIWEKLKKEMEN